MSSGFVSGGTIDNPTERDDEWRRAQAELEEKRLAKEREGQQNDGKSLFEVLQANKGDTPSSLSMRDGRKEPEVATNMLG
jgi:hypothetical protein